MKMADPWGNNMGGNGFGNGGFGGGFGNGGPGGQNLQMKKETHFSKALLNASVIAAVIFFLLGEVIYGTLISNVSSIFFVGVYYAVFGIILAICLLIGARIAKSEITGARLLIIGGCILFLLLAGILFEFLYELNFSSTVVTADRFIFAIDNSGSMESNDPEQKRVEAITQLLKNQDENVEFAVYTFANDIECIREMNPISQGTEDLAIAPDGGTPIMGVLRQIMEDMEAGTLPYDDGTQVILLTDGYSTDIDFLNLSLNRVLKKYNKKHVSVSTVGLGFVDKNMLNTISGKTGGISVTTDNVDDLAAAMASAVRVTDSSRNLLSARAVTSHNWLYALMRIVFTLLLGAAICGIKMAAAGEAADTKRILISSAVGIVLGTLILEIGLSLILTELFARLFLVILFSLVITTVEEIITIKRGTDIGQLGRIGM